MALKDAAQIWTCYHKSPLMPLVRSSISAMSVIHCSFDPMNAETPTPPPTPGREAGRYEGHTPGPWKLDFGRYPKSDKIFGYCVLAEGKVPFIASAGIATPNHGLIQNEEERRYITIGYSSEEVEANARLIADAPALLARLARLERDLRTYGAHFASCTSHQDQPCNCGLDAALKGETE